jgi:hypothetical protein
MTDQNVYKIWKVRAKDSADAACTFDARLLFHDRIGMPLDQLVRDSAESPKGDYFDYPAPFEQPLPNRPFTLVVRPRGAFSIKVSIEDFDANGPTGAGHWCDGSSVIIVHTDAGTASASLPEDPHG